MKIEFNKDWGISSSIQINTWQNNNDIIFVDIAKYDAERLFMSVFSVDKYALRYNQKEGYEYVKATLDALKDNLVKENIACILIQIISDRMIYSLNGLEENKIGKRRYIIYKNLIGSYQVSFCSTQEIALSKSFQVSDLKNDPGSYIDSEIFKLLVANYDLVLRITREYEGIDTF